VFDRRCYAALSIWAFPWQGDGDVALLCDDNCTRNGKCARRGGGRVNLVLFASHEEWNQGCFAVDGRCVRTTDVSCSPHTHTHLPDATVPRILRECARCVANSSLFISRTTQSRSTMQRNNIILQMCTELIVFFSYKRNLLQRIVYNMYRNLSRQVKSSEEKQ
jgi:hypothetical protein